MTKCARGRERPAFSDRGLPARSSAFGLDNSERRLLLGQPGIGCFAAFGANVLNEALFGKVADVYIGA